MTTAVGRSVPPQRLINLVNPLVRAVLQSPLHRTLDSALLVLHIAGRKTGRRYDIPVSYLDIDGHLIVITQHTWRVNARGGADIEVTYRGHRQIMHGDLDEDPTSVTTTLHRVIERIGWKAAQRQLRLKTPRRPHTQPPRVRGGRARVQPRQPHAHPPLAAGIIVSRGVGSPSAGYS